MNDKMLQQLVELATAFERHSLKVVVCGGLGVYLCLFLKNFKAEQRNILRVTNDIDLMLTKQHVSKLSNRELIAQIITDELKYIVREEGRYFHFQKNGPQYLEILAAPIDGVKVKDFRSKLVKSRLHGYYTPEAKFIEEGLRTVMLSDIWPASSKNIGVQVPSPVNLLIMKLYAFDDRDEKGDTEHCQAHAYDVYAIVTLTDREDFHEGRDFLFRHADSRIIQRAQSIVKNKFFLAEQNGWRSVLSSSAFYSDLSISQKNEFLEQARRRLLRWFDV